MMHSSAPSVGATNTNIVVGAPGKNGGTGEVYEFEGDTTQPNFGDLLLDIPNPHPAARLGLRCGRRGDRQRCDRRGADG